MPFRFIVHWISIKANCSHQNANVRLQDCSPIRYTSYSVSFKDMKVSAAMQHDASTRKPPFPTVQFLGHWRASNNSLILSIWKYADNQFLGWVDTHYWREQWQIDSCFNGYDFCTMLNGLFRSLWLGRKHQLFCKQPILMKLSRKSKSWNSLNGGRIEVMR